MTRQQTIKVLNNLASGSRYFRGSIRGTQGIWERKRNGVKPILIFVRRPNYKKLFDFHKTAESAFNKNFDSVFNRSLKQALGGSR